MKYPLFPQQEKLLRLMVNAAESGCLPQFALVANSQATYVLFTGDDGRRAQIECGIGDLKAFAQLDFVSLDAGGGVLLPKGLKAVRNNFEDEDSPSNPFDIGR